jgi:hypothetical protein
MAESAPSAAPSSCRRRKAHNKSRSGCLQCKKRHKKVRLLPLFSTPDVVDHNHPNSNPSEVCLLGLQCDEVFPTCSHCKCTDSDCSLSNQDLSPLPNAGGKKLNLDDMKLLHNWTSRSRITFSDHNAVESLQQGDHEIKVGFQNPYGTCYSLT